MLVWLATGYGCRPLFSHFVTRRRKDLPSECPRAGSGGAFLRWSPLYHITLYRKIDSSGRCSRFNLPLETFVSSFLLGGSLFPRLRWMPNLRRCKSPTRPQYFILQNFLSSSFKFWYRFFTSISLSSSPTHSLSSDRQATRSWRRNL